MVMFVKLFYLSMSFLVVSSDPDKRDGKNISQIGIKIHPVKVTVESNTISESQEKYYNSQENLNNTAIKNKNEYIKLLNSLWNLFEWTGNNLSPKPSNPHLFTMLKILLIPKNPFTTRINIADKHPHVVPTAEVNPATKTVPTTTKAMSTTGKDISSSIETISTTTKAMSTTKKEIFSTTETISTTPRSISTTKLSSTDDDDDDNARPIVLKDLRILDFGKSDVLSKKMPEVEHGSIQYTS